MMKKIESINNPLVRHLIKLRQDKNYRLEQNLCLIMGNKMVADLLKKDKLSLVITSKREFFRTHENTIVVTQEIMKKITGLPSPEPLAAEVPLPQEKELSSEKLLVVLDKIKDPGNLGTIIRTAHGLGWDGVILTPKSCDPFNDKALRSAKGSTFFIPIFQKDAYELSSLIQEKKYTPYLAKERGKSLSGYLFTPPLLLILSSESHGPDKWAKNIENKVSIPLEKNIDSLNVAISGGILMYEIIQKVNIHHE